MNSSFDAANKTFAEENTLFADLGLTGKKIKSIREQLGMSLREWASEAGVALASQHDIEQGTCGNSQLVLFSWMVVPKMLMAKQQTCTDILGEYLKHASKFGS